MPFKRTRKIISSQSGKYVLSNGDIYLIFSNLVTFI